LPSGKINLKACTLSSMTFFRRDWELNPSPSGCHAPRALASVLADIATMGRQTFMQQNSIITLQNDRQTLKTEISL